jgi:polyisoprenoid-binding protein YceI
MRFLPRLLLAIAGPCAAAFSYAAPVDYAVDPVHTRIAFRVVHAGFSHALGTFSAPSGTLRFDPDDWSTAKLELNVPIASLDLGDKDWNGKVLDGTFFDVGKLPQATFASTAVEKIDDTRMRVHGDLTIHGVTRPVEFEATFNALKRHPLTFRRTAGFSATLKVSRKEFGMGNWASVIGDEVEILVELEATRAHAGKDDDAPSPQAADDKANDDAAHP